MNKDTSIYYDIRDDLEEFPDACIYVIVGGRNTGKTYSALKYEKEEGNTFAFMKRTDEDVSLICSGKNGKKDERGIEFDLSPFKSLNRDMGWNVHPVKIFKGIGGFYNCDYEDNSPVGEPISYIVSLHKVQKVKGFDMTDCRDIIFDEFIPEIYERVDRNEGVELLDFYKTVSRANFIKYGQVLRLILLSNSNTVSCPILNTLELTDTLVTMEVNEINKLYLPDRAIFIHRLEDKNGFREEAEKEPIYKAMKGTTWAERSLSNKFAYNDFSNVNFQSIKKMRCLMRVTNKQRTYYIYVGDDGYYMTYKKSNQYTFSYDLNHENDQKKFYYDQITDLRNSCIDGRMKFETYEMYDLIVNYKNFYKV